MRGGRPRRTLNIKGDPVVVLALPLERKTLKQVAERTKLALVLTDGKAPLAIGRDRAAPSRSWRRWSGGRPSHGQDARAAARRPASRCPRP